MDYEVIAFYILKPIEEPRREIKRWKKFLETLDGKGRIYINKKGINAQMSLFKENLTPFSDWLLKDYPNTEVKVQRYQEHAFAKLTVKYREQLAAMDKDYDLSQGGTHLSSAEWAKMIEERDEDTVILDVRNDYEWEVGHFEGTEKPTFETFREFPKYVEEMSKERDPKKTKVMMYCTGGIRCELYSCLFKEQGFEEVYQLDGGVIKYGQEQGNKHWKGNLFVFDDRLVVPIADEENEVISSCKHCGTKIDTYYNCANMDCNDLFLSCLDCAEKMKGCCTDACIEAPRRRPFTPTAHPKPFRKLPHEEKICAPS
ncbi:rhodanese-related sulfurtransferase [Candidatus Neptunochlamydia vexilliferae]|uniref:tRNA uridine(34) hydroxylase n=1 Tax=Candidatus Neptunichlamydia vexilliferae TaxID=1651774 RepID=A0ABS0B0T4_9BACT|nr:rhodanese-related sulfurtransferase [Candidatus Neptunochlamydia vexilliferae]MBF5060008.1 UPF0176 protein [Candidatus Neptunochlamydia vexilliferae]